MQLPNDTLLQGGKYRIVRFISAGGFGCTYEAEHVMLNKRVAIKEFFVKDFCNRDESTSHVTVGIQTKVALVSKLKKKFLEEAIALSKFHNENIVQVTDVFEDNGTAYYVMDYINGKSIHDILKTENTIAESRAVKYICQVANALKYVHSQNRLHLDIKPGNIMIDEHDNAILIDFGASKQYDEESGENTSTLLGKTPGYAPIEQMGNSVQTFIPATDIYSLGATLYKMLTGITPPEANILVADDESLKPLPSYITAETRNAVEWAMKVKRKDRPQSVDVFVRLFSMKQDVRQKSVEKLKSNVIRKEETVVEVWKDSVKNEYKENKQFSTPNTKRNKLPILFYLILILICLSEITGWNIVDEAVEQYDYYYHGDWDYYRKYILEDLKSAYNRGVIYLTTLAFFVWRLSWKRFHNYFTIGILFIVATIICSPSIYPKFVFIITFEFVLFFFCAFVYQWTFTKKYVIGTTQTLFIRIFIWLEQVLNFIWLLHYII